MVEGAADRAVNLRHAAKAVGILDAWIVRDMRFPDLTVAQQIEEMLRDTSCSVETIRGNPDPLFGGINPEPMMPQLEPLGDAVRKSFRYPYPFICIHIVVASHSVHPYLAACV